MGLALLGAANGCGKVERPARAEPFDIRYVAEHFLRVEGDLAVYANMDWGEEDKGYPSITVVFINMTNNDGDLYFGVRGATTAFYWPRGEAIGSFDSAARVWGGPHLAPGECAIYDVIESGQGFAKQPYLVKVTVDYTWTRANGTKKKGTQRFRFVPPDIQKRVRVRD